MNKSEKVVNGMGILFLCIIFLSWCVFFSNKWIDFVDSDLAAELILGKLLSEENGIISSNWFYTTELRVLASQLIYAFMFELTDDWYVVRIASHIIMYFMLLWSYYYLCIQINCKKYFTWSAVCLMIPFSIEYANYVLIGCYYIGNLILAFLIIGMVFQYLHVEKIRANIIMILSFALSVMVGMSGLRMIISLYLPLFMAAIGWTVQNAYIDKADNKKFNYKFFAIAGVLLLAGVIGYGVNSLIFSKIYHFEQWGNISYTSVNWQRIIDAVNGFLASFGYQKGNVFSGATVINFGCLILCLVSVWSIIRGIQNKKDVSNEYRIMSLFVMSAIVIHMIIYAVSDMLYFNRYNLSIVIYAVPLVMVNIKEFTCKKHWKRIGYLVIIVPLMINGIYMYKELNAYNITQEKREIVSLLEADDYNEGYATFWNANVLTELSQGNIEVWCGNWMINTGNGMNMELVNEVVQISKWGQLASHMDEHPEGKVFMLFEQGEINNCVWKDKLKAEDIIYESNSYIVYGFESYETISSILEESTRY